MMVEENRKYKVLVVDDEEAVEPMFRQRMRREIRGGQYEFVFARSGIEAMQLLDASSDIDMVITDINMPEMDGLELLEQINGGKLDLRSVILSAYGDMSNIRSAMNHGAFDFITKPVDFDDLRVTIARTLENIERWREASASHDELVSLHRELELANEMQQMIVPGEFPLHDRYEVFGRMRPARNVGGDFFDVLWLDDRNVGLVVADVSGKGVPAALMMMSSRTLLKGVASNVRDPGEVLGLVNDMLCDGNRLNMFVSVFYGVYDIESGVLRYANAGHNSPLLEGKGMVSELNLTNGVVLGLRPGCDFKSDELQLSEGDTVVLFTDGVSEAEDAESEAFGMERFSQVLLEASGSVQETIEKVFARVDEFTGRRPQFDDITCFALRRKC